jgi:hypothetical protein
VPRTIPTLRRSTAFLAAIAATALLAPNTAHAFVRTTTCVTNNPAHPFACREDETPLPIRWPDACVTWMLQQDGTADWTDLTSLQRIVNEAFLTWNDVECAYFEATYGGTTESRVVGVTDGMANGNVVLFVDSGWRHARNIQALTSVSYRPDNGEIADADIEMNSEYFAFGVVATAADAGITDLANTLVHEVGHFLGLDHTTNVDFVGEPEEIPLATMYASALSGEVNKATLEADDIAGICAAYPATVGGQSACTCTTGECAGPEEPTKRGCAAGTGAHAWWLLALAYRRKRRQHQ